MNNVPEDLRRRLKKYDQEHVLKWWDTLAGGEKKSLLAQLEALDLDLLRRLYDRRDEQATLPPLDQIMPVPYQEPAGVRVQPAAEETPDHRPLAEQAWKKGEAAVLIVAGGQGTRLHFPQPKGMFPIGPVTGKCLFQIHAEKVLALRRRYQAAIPLLVMTSPATHEETQTYFRGKNFFGLPAEEVFFFCQGTMPALDLTTGKLLMEKPGGLFQSPNGHGGTLTALAASGLLAALKKRGVRTLFYFQVDNPLVQLGDRDFLGAHLAGNIQVSSKVVPKETPQDRLGVFVQVNQRLRIIEYSDLPDTLARQTDEKGRLRFWAGSPAIHLFQLDFIDQVLKTPGGLPWHLARKKVPHIDDNGNPVEPARENALKFEMFIFDVLPMVERWQLVPTSRRQEFAPLKNETGPDSPAVVRQAMSNRAADWLVRAGARVIRQANGDSVFPLEISSLVALEADDLAGKIKPEETIDGPRSLE